MEGVSQHFNRRTLILVGCIVAILIYGIVTSFILSNNSSKSPKEFVQSQLPNQSEKSSLTGQPKTSPEQTSQSTGTTLYKSSLYTLSYPSDWKVEEVDEATIHLARFNPSSALISGVPILDIETTLDDSVFQKRLDNLSIDKFTKTSTSFHGMTATKMEGIISLDPHITDLSQPQAQKQTVKRVYWFFSKEGVNYGVSYLVDASANNQIIINQLNAILATLSLK